MPKYKAVLDSIDDLPEPVQELYSKKGDVFELTGIEGVKTQGDFDRLNGIVAREREANKELKSKYAPLADLELEDVLSKLDKYDELEAAANGKLDDEKISELADKRLKSQLAPKDRQIKTLGEENTTLKAENEKLKANERRRLIHDQVREAATRAKLLDTAVEDALFMAERIFEVDEEGTVMTRDGVGVTPGSNAYDWLMEFQDKRPHWWPASQGGGSRGSGQGGAFPNNPWSKNSWNRTEQAALYRQNPERATKMAEAAGSQIGAASPPA